MKIIFVVNSQIKNLKKVINEITVEFEPFQISIIQTNYKRHAVEISTEAVLNGYDYVIAVGGDGNR